MAIYTVKLTPTPVTQVSEGNLDTAVVGGNSVQRTFNNLLVVNGSDMKMVGRIADGGTYDNTTFETPAVSEISIGNSYFNPGSPVVENDNATTGHPTARGDSGSTL